MLLTRIPPTSAELVALALTPFANVIADAETQQVASFAEIAASLAAERWEREHGCFASTVVSREVIAESAEALKAHGQALRDTHDNALYQAHAKIERSLSLLATTRDSIQGSLPLAAAERLMDHVETHFDHIRIALTRAAGVFEDAIDRIEWAASAQRRREAV